MKSIFQHSKTAMYTFVCSLLSLRVLFNDAAIALFKMIFWN